MGRKETTNSIILLTTSFIGGVAAGLLLAPKSGARNRAWLTKRVNELTHWVNDQRKSARRLSKKEIHKFHRHVQQGVRQNVPDLYDATEDIELSEQDLNGE
ncbi:YtxH domain-containing protein [Fodinibius halophilus]|uniref:YtxH domain-containing protein n=1 Tax=Fodinibius halophilus TaxID=1736908 RepID=A0A6M1T656_9BACT|nr:YtxH domain-containing protein [Fodinibius halophilus]NGP89597.1 YtxH domain-containing protein [Fodinibius halophilus]